MKTHYSIADLLALKLDNFPTTRRGWEYLVKTNNWKYREVPSRGKGGIRKEYEVNSEIQSFLHLKEIKNKVNSEIQLQETQTQAICTQQSNELLNWQREIAENRLFVVRYIQQQIKQGLKKTSVIEQFIANAEALLLPEDMQIAVQKANAKAGEGRTVSRRSLFDWVKAVDDAEKHKTNVIGVLAPKTRQSEIPAWAVELLKLWAQPQKPTLPAVLELLPNYLKADVSCPTYNQAYRFIKEKMGNVEAQRGRMGSRELKNLQPFIRRDTEQLLPTDVYTADGHCFDAEIAHPMHGKPFRPEITAIIDVATRRLVGWSIDLAESGWAVLDAVRMSACECGIPAIFYVDNGSGYKNQMMGAKGRGVMARLNTEMSHALPYNSQAKGLIERSHQSLWIKAAKNLQSYIGKDMDAEASNKMFKLTRSEIKQVGVSKSLMAWADFLVYAESVVNGYNNKPHKGLKRIVDPVTLKRRHQSPLEAWDEALEMGATIDRVEDWDAEDLFRPYEERKVRRGEIELFGNRYFSQELSEYHGDNVLVGYDIHNADRITVRDDEGRLICYAFWNANKRAYFPQTKVEQARQRRADGRLRRLAVKQDEVLLEANPQRVIQHMENQTVIPFNSNKHTELMAELNALPLKQEKEVIYFKSSLQTEFNQPIQHAQPISQMSKWIDIDQRLTKNEEVNEEDRDLWEMYPLSKKFKQQSEDDAVLKSYLAQRQGA
ncbi:transposase [Acinetobacter sp. ANC 4470]|uniref:Mu transposase C-terminal domain-containing protein n=1 Tax=Acinetobacter sp. ANC 4470 TaxID=1977881 RepID=UPI000A332240|nr:Mu transposase C-terminal domain-containing protein [Acinetobacter sp. ANC 4470]OTG68280.1 transposase [Acinetobacter sp. ANC 4470]